LVTRQIYFAQVKNPVIVFGGTLLASAAVCGFVAWRFGRAPHRPSDGVDEVNIDAVEDLPAEALTVQVEPSVSRASA
jgi:hypothetical protein